MTSLPSPPFVNIDGICNFRDIGGYPVSAGRKSFVRRGLVFRSAETSNVTDIGLRQLLQDLKVMTIFDLRSSTELKGRTNFFGKLNYTHIPVFPDRNFSPLDLIVQYRNEGFSRAYSDILKMGPPAFRQVFEHLRDRPNETCLIHCTAGKDRTGICCALILGIAGCDDETIAREYALTNLGLADWKPKFLAPALADPVIAENESTITGAMSAHHETMLATLSMIRKQYGGIDEYIMSECGFSRPDITCIRTNIILHEPMLQ